jgi:hypothetical protein
VRRHQICARDLGHGWGDRADAVVVSGATGKDVMSRLACVTSRRVKVAGPPRRTALVEGLRGYEPRGRPFE